MGKSLLPRIARGERDAVAQCVDRYGNLVWSLARRFIADRGDAEDAVQEIFIDLWSNAGRYDTAKGTEMTFVAMIARRRLIDRVRKAKREPLQEDIESVPELAGPGPELDLETRDAAARAGELMRVLKPEQQQIIRLAVYHGCSHQTIATKMGLPLGTVKTHLRRGLLRIRDGMAARIGPGKEATT